MASLSFLDIVNICANTRIGHPDLVPNKFDNEPLIAFHLSPGAKSAVLGLLRPQIVEQIKTENESENLPKIWDFSALNEPKPRISLVASLNTHLKRTAAFKELCERWRDASTFSSVCGPSKWREELYPVYKDPFGAHDYPDADESKNTNLNFAFELERAACALFGIVTYGIHMSIYKHVPLGPSGKTGLFMWVPTRAKTKQTWPGMLDNTVAGGAPSGMDLFTALIKESKEEANLEEEIVREHARAIGCISYLIRTSEGWLQPEVEYCYDIAIPSDADDSLFTPRPLDGEVEHFEWLSADEVIARMRQAKFKPNCALVIIDLLIRLGYINPDNEPDYLKIITRIHGQFDYEQW